MTISVEREVYRVADGTFVDLEITGLTDCFMLDVVFHDISFGVLSDVLMQFSDDNLSTFISDYLFCRNGFGGSQIENANNAAISGETSINRADHALHCRFYGVGLNVRTHGWVDTNAPEASSDRLRTNLFAVNSQQVENSLRIYNSAATIFDEGSVTINKWFSDEYELYDLASLADPSELILTGLADRRAIVSMHDLEDRLFFTMSDDGGATFDTGTNYDEQFLYGTTKSDASGQSRIIIGTGNTTITSAYGTLEMVAAGLAEKTYGSGHYFANSTGAVPAITRTGIHTPTAVQDAMRLVRAAGGNFTQGHVLYHP